MKTDALRAAAKPGFVKTEVSCLYRYSSNGVYYALLKHQGKQKRASLETTDKAAAKRKLADLQRDSGKVDSSPGGMTLREFNSHVDRAHTRSLDGVIGAHVHWLRDEPAESLERFYSNDLRTVFWH